MRTKLLFLGLLLAPLWAGAAMFQVPISGSGNGNATNAQPPSTVLTNLAGTGAITNTPNTWYFWTAPGATNKYFAENRALPVILFSNDFTGLFQNVANQMGDGAYLEFSGNPYYTNHYIFTNTVLITNFVVIEGQNNPSTVFRAAPDLAGPMIRLGTNATLPGIPGIARFRNLRFEGDQGATNCVGIQVLKCAEPVFQNCEWTGFKMAGVQYSSTNYIHWAEVDNCWFVQKWPSTQGILIDASPLQSQAQNHLIIRNSIFGIFGGGNAITISNWFPGVEIRNSHFRYSTGTSEDVVQVWAGGGFDFSDNRFQNVGNAIYPFAFYDRTALGTGTNYNINLTGNTVDNVGSSATDTLAYIGDYVQGVTDIGNSVGVQLGLAGNNGNINTVTRDGITLKTITASRAVATSASGDVTNATTTLTELDYLSGVTSAIQTQLNSKQNGSPTLTNFIAMGITNITSANANTVITTNGGVLVLTTAASGGGGTNFANLNILFGDTNLVLSSGVEKSFRQDTNGSHGINLSLAVPESGYRVRYAVSNSGSSEITITLNTNAVAANMYDIASKTNVNSVTAEAAAITQWDMTYTDSGIWLVSGLEGPTKNLIFGSGISAVTNGVNGRDVTISASASASAVDFPEYRTAWAMVGQSSATPQSLGENVAVYIAGSVLAPTATNEVGIKLATSATANGSNSVYGLNLSYAVGRNVKLAGLYQIFGVTNASRHWVGLYSSSADALTQTDLPTTKHAALLRVTETNSNWWFVTCNGSACEEKDTGVAATEYGRYKIKVEETATVGVGTNWIATINGSTVATNSTTIPRDNMRWAYAVTTLEAAAKTNVFEFIRMRSDVP